MTLLYTVRSEVIYIYYTVVVVYTRIQRLWYIVCSYIYNEYFLEQIQLPSLNGPRSTLLCQIECLEFRLVKYIYANIIIESVTFLAKLKTNQPRTAFFTMVSLFRRPNSISDFSLNVPNNKIKQY